jgi:hypothetical protein
MENGLRLYTVFFNLKIILILKRLNIEHRGAMEIEFQQTNEMWTILDNVTLIYPDWMPTAITHAHEAANVTGSTGTTGIPAETVSLDAGSNQVSEQSEMRGELLAIVLPTVIGGCLLMGAIAFAAYKFGQRRAIAAAV